MTNRHRPIKIIFDATPMIVERTGVAYYTDLLVTHLAKQYPNEIELVGFYYNFLGRRDTSHLHRLPNLRYMGASIIPSKVVYQLRRWGIEVPVELLALTTADFILYPNFLSYPSLKRTPSAPVLHDLTYLDLPETVSAKLRRDLVRFVPQAIKRSSFIITVSEFSKERIMTHYKIPSENIVVTPIPPLPSPPIAAATSTAALKNSGITKPYILFVGTIEPRKNIPSLIDAYRKLPPDIRAEYTLVIAGRMGWNCHKEVAALARAAKDKLDVLHLGYVSDDTKAVLYERATLFAHASHYEGFGMPVLEAMKHGLPCTISNIPVFREVAGDTVAYIDHTNPDAIARLWVALLRDPNQRKALGSSAKRRATTAFSWQHIATDLFERIQQVVDPK